MFSKLYKSDGAPSTKGNGSATTTPKNRKVLSRLFAFKSERKTQSTEKLLKSRKEARVQKTKKMISARIKYLEDSMKPKDVLHPGRPYGLPPEMEGKRVHVWRLIFEHVNDYETVINLRKVSVMFSELVERKYVAVMLPQVIGKPILSDNWEGGGTAWLKAMVELRTLSKASKNSVDSIIIAEGLLGKEETNWFSVWDPHYDIIQETSVLRLGVSESEQRRLDKILKELDNAQNLDFFPVTALTFDEVSEDDDEFDADMAGLKKKFETVIEKLGKKITSFFYQTQETSFETYANLGRWLTFMPNLQDLIVELKGEILLNHWEKTGKITIAPFPPCPRLKRYVEGTKGFGVPFLKEIIKANPTIQEVLLGDIPCDEWDHVTKIIGTLPMTKFHSTCIPRPPFFENRFPWVNQLSSLALWDPTDRFTSDISSKKFFKFISCFKSLVVLKVATPHVQDTGGSLHLAKLLGVTWKVFPTFKTLKFLQPVENLRYLGLDMSQCADTKRQENVLQFLADWNVPSLFPALNEIRVRTQKDGPFIEISTRV